MATIIKRIGRNGVSYQVKVRRKGHPLQTASFDKKADAESWASGLEGDIAKGKHVDLRAAKSMPLRDALARYEREKTPHKKGKKQEKSRLGLWRDSELADRSLADIRASDISRWRDKRLAAGASPNTVKNDLILLSHLFTTAAREWGMEALLNPVRQVSKPRLPPGRDRRLNKKEEKTLLNAAKDVNSPLVAPIIEIAIQTGMRQSEILSLRWSAIDFVQRIASLADTKNGEKRDVPLSKRATEILQGLKSGKSNDIVFPMPVSTLEKHFSGARKAAKLENLRFHDLRHEAVSRFFEKGLNPMQVAAISGHKTLTMLKRYTHLKAVDLAKLLD